MVPMVPMVPGVPPLKCPHCRMADQVQKVSALVTAGAATSIATGYLSGVAFGTGYAGGVFGVFGQTYETGSQQTVISLRLSPPAPPALGSKWTDGAIAGRVVFISLLVIYGFIALVGAVLGRWDPALFGAPFALAFIGGLVAVVWATQARGKRLQVAWQEQYVRWQAAMARWDALYYCGRDDAVFFPGSPSAVPAAAMCGPSYERRRTRARTVRDEGQAAMLEDEYVDCFRLLTSGRLERIERADLAISAREPPRDICERLGYEGSRCLRLGADSAEYFCVEVYARYDVPEASAEKVTAAYRFLVVVTVWWPVAHFVFVEDLPDLLPFLAQLATIASATLHTSQHELDMIDKEVKAAEQQQRQRKQDE